VLTAQVIIQALIFVLLVHIARLIEFYGTILLNFYTKQTGDTTLADKYRVKS